MKKFVSILGMAAVVFLLLGGLEYRVIRKRLSRESGRLAGALHYFGRQNFDAARLVFSSPESLKKARPAHGPASEFYPTFYSDLGLPKASPLPALSPVLRPQKTRLPGGNYFWMSRRFVVQNGKLWVETLGSSQRWPRDPRIIGAPIFGLAAVVPKEFLRPADSRMTLILAEPNSRFGRFASARVNFPDRDSSEPEAVLQYHAESAYVLAFLIAAAATAVYLRITRGSPRKSETFQEDLEDERTYLSKTYQTLSHNLRMERQKVEAILNSAPDGIFTCSPAGTVTFWNRSMEILTHLSKETAVGQHYRNCVNFFSEGGQLLADPFSHSFDQRKTVGLTDCQMEALPPAAGNGGGVVIPVTLGAAPVTAALEGPVEEIVVTVKDMRPLKAAEELRRDMQAMITHDLRSPLTAMLGYASLIQNAKIRKNEQDAQKYLESLMRAGKEMLMLISNLLRCSGLEDGKFNFQKEAVRVSPLIKETVDYLGVLAKPKNLTIHVNAGDDLLALTDAERLKEILGNLITNAVKFTRAGGAIRVTAQAQDSKIRISVADQGPGIPPEERKDLFQKFSTLRKPGSGTGLGLYIVKTLAKALDGIVEVETEAGKGSIFSVLLPAFHKARTHTEQLSLFSLAAAEGAPAQSEI